ncbi:hypothetical protein [Klebsiella pneumoniae]|uniref:hypothetical protein n=1 Tax=Klebsiella pneumoniae TaxID=573 RepID=UPI000E2CE32C|nr:hypothetical protein [Klebsiella pneumoniae]SVT96174.1 Uncharacterised protein [Klebsiella pneumoniae]
MKNEVEQIALQNDMSIEFVTWFFNEKKVGCGNVWFMMMAAMWEGWKGRSIEMDKLAAENVALKNAIECHKAGFTICEACGEENGSWNDDVCKALDDIHATDRIVAEAEARGVDKFAAEQRGVAGRLQKSNLAVAERSISFCLDSAEEAEVFAKQLREGADK